MPSTEGRPVVPCDAPDCAEAAEWKVLITAFAARPEKRYHYCRAHVWLANRMATDMQREGGGTVTTELLFDPVTGERR